MRARNRYRARPRSRRPARAAPSPAGCARRATRRTSRETRARTRCAGVGITEFFAGHHAEALEILTEAERQLHGGAIGNYAEITHLRNFILFTLRRLGAYGELRDRLGVYTRDARLRGDRYAGTSYTWSSNIVWLAADDVARAKYDLESVTWSDPADGLHLQHWFLMRSGAELALYQDALADIDDLEPKLRLFLGSAFAHVEAVATETRYLLARFAIRRGDPAAARRADQPHATTEAPNHREIEGLFVFE